MFTHLTEIFDETLQESGGYQGQIGLFHGFAQCQDVWFETALHFAMNGFRVLLIDFEGFGFSGGSRIAGLTIPKMHV